jgi:hypothetical protein
MIYNALFRLIRLLASRRPDKSAIMQILVQENDPDGQAEREFARSSAESLAYSTAAWGLHGNVRIHSTQRACSFLATIVNKVVVRG